ncbi:rod shape-determining protein RodA [Candidatus Azobacteroides pseudotrichonymphae]|uniref:Cell wall polymerase n=1 Tax=Azobacteroides pseudotrichonymphae genomovar. CFP2 TaxID=511995 RepID=B6YRG9_AZOPC|nr:rod shape-determining protein RodA [Candidatus Azobacteroides pseudotrichonymphae]BAG83791.1 rod shape-determining protein RodA [Candidatus Azobacteroides pseudotrichonymphae genomovar. CFP2]
MLYGKNSVWNTLDWLTVRVYLVLVLIGWFCIYAASYECNTGRFDFSNRASMQMVWILSSLCIAFVLLMIEGNWYEVFAFGIYIAVMLLLIVTVFVATPIKGSCSWLTLGAVRIQPAEFAKFATALAVAKVMGRYQFDISKKRSIISLLGLVFLPISLILLQRETGSALVFFVFFLVFYREGMSGKILLIGFSAALIFVLVVRFPFVVVSSISCGELLGMGFIIFCVMGLLLQYNYSRELKHVKYLFCAVLGTTVVSISMFLFTSFNVYWIILSFFVSICFYFLFLFMKNRFSIYLWIVLFIIGSFSFLYSTDYIFDNVLELHQKNRVQVALGIIDDPRGAGYNVNQSKIAIGSGGFKGKGYLRGTQTELKYVPEQETDFIFCTLGEEMGFIGSVTVLVLFLILIIRLVWLAEKQQRVFIRVYGYSVACIIFFHFAINIGMVLGITPVIGIPLSFLSYGGSSLWSFTILLFIFLRLDTSKRFGKGDLLKFKFST